MEIKVKDLVDYIGLPLCYVCQKPGYKGKSHEWVIIKSVFITSDKITVRFTDDSDMDIKRSEPHTKLWISV